MSFKNSFHPIVRLSATVLALSFVLPISTYAATDDLEVSGWIPYWRTEAGTTDTRKHLDQLSEVNPFGYTVRSDGTLNDAMNLSSTAWQRLFKDARAKKVRVVPSIMWSDANAMHTVLSSSNKRKEHIAAIVRAVERNNFDGIDIDYEGKKAETRDAYSAFLKELQTELSKGKKDEWLQCTIEARMPLEARFSGTPPANIEYANDLPKINRYCDRVRIMTYDQQTADVQLNRKHAEKLYAPVSDVAWVEKVMNYMDNDISRNKLVMGIPTYGYIWQAMPNANGTSYSYIKMESFNPLYGVQTAKEHSITPARGPSGELGFSYVPDDNHPSLPSQSDLSRRAPSGTQSAYLAAAGALALAKDKRQQAPLLYLTWSDAEAIRQKVALASKLNIAGVAVFKFDGGTDPDMWDVLPDSAPKSLTPPKNNTSTSTDTPEPVPTPTPGNASGVSFTRDLAFGDENADVLRLQNILVSKGYLKATPTGYYGQATLAAVRAWQAANGLPATGNFGPMSRTKMAQGA